LVSTKYYGVAIPFGYIDFGSSCMVGNLGAPMRYMDHVTVWPERCLSGIDDILDVSIKHESQWYKLVYNYLERTLSTKNISTACYALGGVGDTVGSLYGEESLLVDMIENTESVVAAFKHIKCIWIEEFEKQTSLIRQSGQIGMCGWSGIWAPGSTFPIQEDMGYNLSPMMFDQICLPELMDIIDVVEYPLYHLDGINAIHHLESLLKIGKLKAIQWVPGAGHEAIAQWFPLIKRILDAGKPVQLYVRAEEIDSVVHSLGTRGILLSITDASYDNLHLIERFL